MGASRVTERAALTVGADDARHEAAVVALHFLVDLLVQTLVQVLLVAIALDPVQHLVETLASERSALQPKS